MNPRPGLMTDFSLNWFCHLLFQGSPLHHCPKGTKSISAFIHLFQAWVCSSCYVSDPMAGHRPNSTQRSRPRPTSQQLQEKGLAGRKPEAEGKGKPGALMVRTIPPFSSSLPILLFRKKHFILTYYFGIKCMFLITCFYCYFLIFQF